MEDRQTNVLRPVVFQLKSNTYALNPTKSNSSATHQYRPSYYQHYISPRHKKIQNTKRKWRARA